MGAPKKGPGWLRDYLAAITPVAGSGIGISYEKEGSLIAAIPSGSDANTTSGAATIYRPLYLLNASVTTPGSPPSYQVRVVYGTIAFIQPTGMNFGDNPPFILTVSGSSGTLYFTMTTDSDGVPETASINVGSVPADEDPNGDGTGATFHGQIGTFVIQSGALSVATSTNGSMNYNYCCGPNFS